MESLGHRQNAELRRNETKLTDLNVDCLLLIFDQLDFYTLLSLAEVNKPFSVLAADVYRRKYGNKMVEIRQAFSIDIKTIVEFENRIQIENFDLISTIFKHFGSVISNVKINYQEAKGSRIKDILTLVNRNSESLKQIRLELDNGNGLDGIEKPFLSVERVSIAGEYERLGNEQMNLNEMFPEMRRLSLKHSMVHNQTSMALKFPHLEEFHVAFAHTKGSTENDIRKMIEQNPQIRSLSVHYSTLAFLEFISQHLPNLEHLELPYILTQYSPGNHMHFRHVKQLKIQTISEHFAVRATFEQLEKLELDSSLDVSSIWIEFIGRSNNLTKLNIIDAEISNRELAMLTNRVPNLIEISFTLGAGVEAETIETFLQRNIKLRNADLTCPIAQFSGAQFNILRNRIEKDWTISGKPFGYLFQRKH